jgi:hypothetical protein
VIKSASSIINIIVRLLIHAKAPDRNTRELTSRVNSSILRIGFEIGFIGFELALIGFEIGFIGFELGLFFHDYFTSNIFVILCIY